MQATGWRRHCGRLAVGLFALTWQGPPAAAAASQELEAYVATPAHQQATAKAIQSSGRWQSSGCSQPLGPSHVTFASRLVALAPDGTPSAGLWMERVIMHGCGRDMLLNVAWVINGGRMSGGPMAPGTTRADPVLQADVGKFIVQIAEAMIRPCAGTPSFLYDTSVDPSAPGAAPGSWAERWTIASCNKHVAVPVSFTPDGQGGIDFAVRGDLAIVE